MRVEQHLVGLLPVGPKHERPAMGELHVGDLQLLPLAAHHRPVLAPVELERLARREHQRHERPATGFLRRLAMLTPPPTGEGRYSVIRAPIAERDQIGMHLPQVTPLLTALPTLGRQPDRELHL
jgi:hypothetical protein